jgi:hypothetical protein
MISFLNENSIRIRKPKLIEKLCFVLKSTKNARNDSNLSDYDDNDHYEGATNRRKSFRQVKKLKTNDEFESDASSLNNNNIKAQNSMLNRISTMESINAPRVKQTARKTTIEPLSSNQNQVNIQRPTVTNTSLTTVSSITNTAINSNLTSVVSRSPQITPTTSSSLKTTQLNINPIPNGTINQTVKPYVHQNNGTISNNPKNTIVKEFKNKMISCKPFYQSKATECAPICKDASTQIDLDEIKLSHTVVPVPVPINTYLPMFMYQAPLPVPILCPVPICVPVFIPTTKKTYDRVQRKIKVKIIFLKFTIF